MEQSLVMYRITKPGHRLDMYIGAQPLSNDDGKVTALTIWRWEVNRVPDFYKRKALNEIKSLLISARNRFRNAIDGVMIPPDERYREKSKAFEELEKALKELED